MSGIGLGILATAFEIREECFEGGVLEFAAEAGEVVEEEDDAGGGEFG